MIQLMHTSHLSFKSRHKDILYSCILSFYQQPLIVVEGFSAQLNHVQPAKTTEEGFRAIELHLVGPRAQQADQNPAKQNPRLFLCHLFYWQLVIALWSEYDSTPQSFYTRASGLQEFYLCVNTKQIKVPMILGSIEILLVMLCKIFCTT